MILYYFIQFYGDVYDFDSYKKEVIKKYKKLGGNPEDLDKEESELENPESGG